MGSERGRGVEMAERKRVLVVGGSGYLGQHLLCELVAADSGRHYDVAFTYHRPTPPVELVDALSPLIPFRVDLCTGEGFDSISTDFAKFILQNLFDYERTGIFYEVKAVKNSTSLGILNGFFWSDAQEVPHVIVNCAALSIPRECEDDPAAAMATNLPATLVNWLSSFEDNNILLIHLSTDQVYGGVKSFYKEEDETAPVNMYGKSKVGAELFISAHCSNFAILRSSIIYGPQAVSPVTKSLPVQWIDSVLSQGAAVQFFHDEFRCPVYVKDVVNVILALIKKWISDGEQMKLILNVAGPDRLSRVQMAEAVASYKGYDHSLIKSVSASSVNRGVVSPADISMDISRLKQVLGISPVSFRDGVRSTLETDS